ncbi:MAG: Xylose isomerase-like TIM barrel [bacterium ADurb.Bin429]|nr:MAG: Xylose isomerase-like TIM barrel [bacterium ADurb.Bin429]
MKISIASYAFHGLLAEGKMDVFGYLESCKYRYRVDAADIWNGMLPTTEPDFIRKVRQAMDEKEMVLANLCVDGAHVWDPEPDERERLYLNALAHLRAAVILGARTVRLDVGVRADDISDEAFDYIVMRYQEYARFAADHGFRVGPETHWGASLFLENQLKLQAAVSHPSYGLLLHIGHWNAGDEAQNDAAVAHFTMHTHVDARITRACLEERMTILRDAGYPGYWGVEHHSGTNEYAEVAWQMSEVVRVVKRWEIEQAGV